MREMFLLSLATRSDRPAARGNLRVSTEVASMLRHRIGERFKEQVG